MKFLTFIVAAALAVPQTADAHNRHRPNARAAATVGNPIVSVTWVWVSAENNDFQVQRQGERRSSLIVIRSS